MISIIGILKDWSEVYLVASTTERHHNGLL